MCISVPAIKADGLRKVFGSGRKATTAVDDLTLTCTSGEVFGLLGPNGAGKTTSLRMLSTVLSPTAGEAQVAGYDLKKDSEGVRQSIGFLSGNTGLYPRLTAREVLRYFGELFGMERHAIAERLEELSALLGMGDFLDRRCDKLSTGMQQKVNVARAVLHDPPVLIMDEPTAGLDVLASRTIVDFIRDCRSRGKCVIFSTHIMGEVGRLCDRLAILHEGKVRYEGDLDGFREGYGDDIEEGFIALLEGSK